MLFIVSSTLLFQGVPLPLHGPVPVARPDVGALEATPKDPAPRKSDDDGLPAVEMAPAIEKEDASAFAACTAELKAIGAEFTEVARIDDGNGCGIDRPIEVKTLGHGVTLAPPGTIRCRTAVNLARWTRDVVTPMLRKSQPNETVAEVNQASAYVCRKRNGADTGKISEHAHGNAIDVAGFTFTSGRTFTIAPREDDSTLNGAFQRTIASAACLYFSTVLDPGSDKAHETHLHLDTLQRKGGYRYCW